LITYKFEITSAIAFRGGVARIYSFGVSMLLILVYRPQGLLREKAILTPAIRRSVKEHRQKKI